MSRLDRKLQLRMVWMMAALGSMAAAAACGSSGGNNPTGTGSTSTGTGTGSGTGISTSSSTGTSTGSTSTSSSTASSGSSSSCDVVFGFDMANQCGPNPNATGLPTACTLGAYNAMGAWFVDAPPAAADAGADGGPSTVDAGGTEVPAPVPCSAGSPYTCVYPSMTYVQATTDNDPGSCADPGYVQFVIPFDNYNEQSDIQWIFTSPQNWAGKILYLRYQLVSGFVPQANTPGGVEIAVKTGSSFAYGASAYTNQPAPVPADGTPWAEIPFDLSMPPQLGTGPDGGPAAFDPTSVMAVELHFDTGAGNPPDAGPNTTLPTTTVFNIDMIGLR